MKRMSWFIGAAMLAVATAAQAQEDPLPSWNDGTPKTAILDFVAAVTTEGARTFLWLVSDNNFQRWQRSLLVEFELVGLPPRRNPSQTGSKKAAR